MRDASRLGAENKRLSAPQDAVRRVWKLRLNPL